MVVTVRDKIDPEKLDDNSEFKSIQLWQWRAEATILSEYSNFLPKQARRESDEADYIQSLETDWDYLASFYLSSNIIWSCSFLVPLRRQSVVKRFPIFHELEKLNKSHLTPGLLSLD